MLATHVKAPYNEYLIVNERLRERVIEEYGDDPGVLRYVAYVVNRPRIPQDNSILFPYNAIEWIMDHSARSGEGSTGCYLETVLKPLFPGMRLVDVEIDSETGEVVDYSHLKKKARCVIKTGLDAIHDDIRLYRKTKHVKPIDITSGTKHTPIPRQHMATYDIQKQVIRLVNRTPEELYTRPEPLFDQVYDVVEPWPWLTTDDGEEEWPPGTFTGVQNIWRFQGCKPHYTATKNGNTMRLFDQRHGWSMLRRDIKLMYSPDFVHYDLSSIQLAAYAMKFKAQVIVDMLKEGSPWESIMAHCGVDSKTNIKKATYALCFGASEKSIAKALDGIDVQLFMSHPIMATVLKHRNKALKDIKVNHGITDAFGRWIQAKRGRSHLSMLADCMQSYEFFCLAPALDYIESHPNLYLMLWEHDGFSVKQAIPDSTELDGLVASVDSWCIQQGIPTRLVLCTG